MVVKMMKWRPWPPVPCKKFEAKIAVHQLKGLTHVSDPSKFSIEIKWKGSKSKSLTSLRRGVGRNFTEEESLIDGVVQWNEEFQYVCALSCYKDGTFHPWEVSFKVFNGLKQQRRNKVSLVATARLNLADYASSSETQCRVIDIPMNIPSGSMNNDVSLNLSITLQEIVNPEEPIESVPRPAILSFPRSPCYGEMFSSSKKEVNVSSTKPSPKRVGSILKGLSALRGKTTGHVAEENNSDSRSSRSDEIDFNSPLDTDSSLGGSQEHDSEEEVTEEDDSNVRKSFGYGTLAYANHARDLIYSNASSSEDEDWIYYSHRGSDVAVARANSESTNVSVSEHSIERNLKRRLIPWRKRKLSLRSPKEKGEPLLKKHYGEEGGDDIDFDRRQLSSSDESNHMQLKLGGDLASGLSFSSAFGDDDDFAVGIWEQREITNRDGHMKLKARVFFASIDQRSERADGESACTALVAVIADWLNSNHGHMPVKSQLDSLIREGSLQWRRLCENEAYMQRFPDKHFDLETVIEAEVRPLSLVHEKSFIGFFKPNGLEHEGFEFLKDAMSFDDIWDEVNRCSSEMASASSDDPMVYIISWNDHFFVLKVERDAYYIIDTLGERLYEGCNQAFVLKFDKDTVIERTTSEAKSDGDDDEKAENAKTKEDEEMKNCKESRADGEEEEEESVIICSGKESCKEYIKSFLAAIPIRELQADVKKGLVNESAPLHQRLQIEFHYTKSMGNVGECLDRKTT